ncbi:MAG TPA: type II toxin-antitoxin system ParD family antitoxin [Acetobacteraceae bacterium]|jgi:antitoxin ParD1/3/4|nr:type II toxin-antitoxin system ParD family antitoxin [Acetobacteraceae bacterium]
MPNVSLTPELERFAESCVQSGRYNSVSEVTRAALRLLQQVEQQRREFLAILDAAEAEGEREGFLTMEEVMQDLDEAIEAASRPRE